MGYFANLAIKLANARDAGVEIDFDVCVGKREWISVHDFAERLKGVVARNGNILYPGWGGGRSARVVFDEKAKHGYRLYDAYGLDADDRRLQDADFRAMVGLRPGERIETCNDELLVYARAEALAKREAKAAALWENARPAAGTIVQRYLKSRGIEVPLGPSLRSGLALHPDERAEYPAMIALVSDASGKPMNGVHLTALRKDGRGKADISSNAKWTLGKIKGGVIRLAEPIDGRIAIAEGIESALSYLQLTGTPTWSALNAGNMKEVVLPPGIRHVVIAGDNDHRGRYAANDARERFRERDNTLTVDLDWPIVVGRDWNDILVRGYLG